MRYVQQSTNRKAYIESIIPCPGDRSKMILTVGYHVKGPKQSTWHTLNLTVPITNYATIAEALHEVRESVADQWRAMNKSMKGDL